MATDVSFKELEERSESQNEWEDLAATEVPEPRSVTFIDYEDPFASEGDASGVPPHIGRLSPNAWVGCGGDVYVLECLGQGFVRIDPNGEYGRDSNSQFLTYPRRSRAI